MSGREKFNNIVDFVFRWAFLILCIWTLVSVFNTPAEDYATDDPVVFWDRVKVAFLLLSYALTGWIWKEHLMEKQLKKISDEMKAEEERKHG